MSSPVLTYNKLTIKTTLGSARSSLALYLIISSRDTTDSFDNSFLLKFRVSVAKAIFSFWLKVK